MKLESFRIKYFRSIKDIDWQNLSPDNITALIGQNESGKTSILEALMAFENAKISDDDLRNDGTFPEIFCKFKLDKNELEEIFEDFILPKNIDKVIKKNDDSIVLSRKWTSKNQHNFLIENKDIVNCFEAKVAGEVELIKNQEGLDSENIESKQEEKKEITIDNFKDELFRNAPQFILFEDNSLLPRTIDVEDLKNKNQSATGFIGASNLLKIVDLNILEIESCTDERMLEDKINSVSKEFTVNFQKYWGQKIGKNDKITVQISIKNHPHTAEETKKGKPYLIFYIKDSRGSLYPDQRSKGVRWFLSFFIQLEAMSRDRKNIILIDEPGNSLHAKAQGDVLKIFEKIKDNLQIIYTTHSPYLVDIDNVHRLLAVQRDDKDDDNDTKIMSIQKLGGANTDTLLPLYTIIGVDLSHQRVIKKKNNVILEEISAFYYLKAFKKIIDNNDEMNFLPATGASNVPLLSNLMLGWDIDFCVFLDDDSQGRKTYKYLKENYIREEKKLVKIQDFIGIEDVFDNKDFEGFVLLEKKDQDNKTLNSDKAKKYSKPLLARGFMLKVKNSEITKDHLSKKTISNIEKIFSALNKAL